MSIDPAPFTRFYSLGEGGVVFHEVANRIRSRARERGHFVYDQHAVHVPELGLTMADGGEPTGETQNLK